MSGFVIGKNAKDLGLPGTLFTERSRSYDPTDIDPIRWQRFVAD